MMPCPDVPADIDEVIETKGHEGVLEGDLAHVAGKLLEWCPGELALPWSLWQLDFVGPLLSGALHDLSRRQHYLSVAPASHELILCWVLQALGKQLDSNTTAQHVAVLFPLQDLLLSAHYMTCWRHRHGSMVLQVLCLKLVAASALGQVRSVSQMHGYLLLAPALPRPTHH
jgi:hypothetical protein